MNAGIKSHQCGCAAAGTTQLQRCEAVENAKDLCSYLMPVFAEHVISKNLSLANAGIGLTRFVFQQWDGQLPIPPERVRDVQLIAGELLAMKLTARIPWANAAYELAMDRLSSLEMGRLGPAHRDRLFARSELAKLAAQWETKQPLDFITAVGLICDCPMRVVYAVIHDGTPSAEELQVACSSKYGHACPSLRFADPTTIGECHTAVGGVMGVTHDLIGRLLIEGVPVRGPLWFHDDELWDWDPELATDQSVDQSEAA